MSAQTSFRDNPKRGTNPVLEVADVGVAANTFCRGGGLAVINSTGYCAPGSTAVGLIAYGWFTQDKDNTTATTGGAAGAVNARIEPGTRYAANSTGVDLIAITNRGQDCFIVDDQTVALTDGGGTRSRAGKIVDVDPVLGVAVEVVNIGTAVAPKVQSGTGTMVAGVLTVSTGVSITAASVITATRKNKAGTSGVVYDAPSADRTVGIPGTGAFKVRSYDSTNTAAAADTSTIDYVIVG